MKWKWIALVLVVIFLIPTIGLARGIRWAQLNSADVLDSLRLSLETGRTATLMVAASDASVQEIGQSDYQCNGTDDNVEMQAAADSVALTKGTLIFSSGTFTISAAVRVSTGCTFDGQGRGTIWGLADGANCNMLENKNFAEASSIDSDITVRNIYFDGNKANQNAAAPARGGGICFGYASNITIENCWFVDTIGYGSVYVGAITPTDSTNFAVRIKDCYFSGADVLTGYAQYGCAMFLTALQTQGLFVTDNYIYKCKNGIALEDNPTNAVIKGNILRGDGTNGVGIWHNLGAPVQLTPGDIVISGNTVLNWGTGISVEACNPAYYNNEEIIVANNIVRGSYNDGIYFGYGGQTGYKGERAIISNNIVKNSSQSGAGSYPGIRVGNVWTDLSIQGNQCWDDQGTKTQSYGIVLQDTSDYAIITGNNVRGNRDGGMLLVGSNNIVKNNIGYKTENSGVASVANGGTIAHGLVTTPTAYFATTTAASHIVAITGVDASNLTVSLTDEDGAGVAVAENVSWWAEVR